MNLSETDPQAAVDVPAFKRCPRVNGPAAVDCARCQEQRIPSRLPDTREVLAVHEETNGPELLFRQETKNHVRLAGGSVRIPFEALAASVVPLDANPADVLCLPHAHDPCAVARRQGHVLFKGVDGLAGSHVGVGCSDREGFPAQRSQELETHVGRRVRQRAEHVRWRALDVQRVVDARGEHGRCV